MRPALLLVAALLSSGCISALASDHDPLVADPSSSQAPTGPGAGTAAGHGAAQRTDGPVQVTLEADGYHARQDVTVRNDFGGAPNGKVQLKTVNGAVQANAWDQGGYRMVAHLDGRGATEQDARAALATMAVVNADSLSAGLLDLGLEVRFNDPPSPLPVQPPVPVQVGSIQRSASIEASLPAQPAETLTASTTNGAVAVAGLHGPSLKLDTTNGAVFVKGAWDKANLDTTNGAVSLDGVFGDLNADTTNGAIGGTVESQRSCTQTLSTTNGSVSVKVKDDGHGYSLKGDTTNGRITIDVAGAHATGKDSATAQTPGYDNAAVQVKLSADATNGNIDLESA